MRLYSYMKMYKNLTKSELNKLFNENRIKVNNKLVNISYIIKDNDIVTLDDVEVKSIEFKYYLYYKPKGILSTISNKDNSYINQIDKSYKLSMAGRLDKDSYGLSILTNDGKFINDILTNPNKEKEYIVKVQKEITNEFFNLIQLPHVIRGKKTNPIKAKQIDKYTLSLILTDGKFHQIRTIIKLEGNYVVDLKRIRIDKYMLDDLKPNELKEFKP